MGRTIGAAQRDDPTVSHPRSLFGLRLHQAAEELDAVGINFMEKKLIPGECKWSPKAMGRDVLDILVQKAAEFIPSEGRRHVYYLGFARGGWLSEAQTFAKSFGKDNGKGENWQAVGMSLLDLSHVARDLKEWSEPKDIDLTISF